MTVTPIHLIQRLPLMDMVPLTATTEAEALELVEWANNPGITYEGEPEPGVFVWHCQDPWALSVYYDIRSTDGMHLAREKPDLYPDSPARLSWDNPASDYWEPYDGPRLAG